MGATLTTSITFSGDTVREKFPIEAGTIRAYPRDDKAGRIDRRGSSVEEYLSSVITHSIKIPHS